MEGTVVLQIAVVGDSRQQQFLHSEVPWHGQSHKTKNCIYQYLCAKSCFCTFIRSGGIFVNTLFASTGISKSVWLSGWDTKISTLAWLEWLECPKEVESDVNYIQALSTFCVDLKAQNFIKNV